MVSVTAKAKPVYALTLAPMYMTEGARTQRTQGIIHFTSEQSVFSTSQILSTTVLPPHKRGPEKESKTACLIIHTCVVFLLQFLTRHCETHTHQMLTSLV